MKKILFTNLSFAYAVWAYGQVSLEISVVDKKNGQPINRIPPYATTYGTTDLNGYGKGFSGSNINFSPGVDCVPVESRNSHRLPWANTFEVGVQFRLLRGVEQKMEFRADVFNVFNANNLGDSVSDGSKSNQLQIGPATQYNLISGKVPRPVNFNLAFDTCYNSLNNDAVTSNYGIT